ncbi:penicillin acylase family protein [Nocardioides solisilvae]|uniref:penicillin acylase family protein n=1 Tax=Nocardioides solisilvae TaxID=1542435 RepID=UPI000D741272|nr:penicillin acylase family protein [Nocardioides solisilvae]
MSDESTATPDPADDHDHDDDHRTPWWRTFLHWPRWARVTTYTAVALVLVLLAGVATAVVMVRRPLPQTDGELVLPGLAADVEVLRDEHGIPQLYADTDEDLLRAQGYVHAQERFFEMDVRRHVTAGRLSELFGETALETDKYIRTMGWRRVAEQELTLVSPETRGALEAYAAGVNAYLDEHSPSQIAVEYTLLGLTGLSYAPQDWTAVDSLAWLKAMAWDLRGNMQEEIDRVVASLDNDAETVDLLHPPYDAARHAPIVTGGAVVDGRFTQEGSVPPVLAPVPAEPAAVAVLEEVGKGLAALPPILGRGDGLGSNSWVVSGERSATGMPLLANDPHLGVSLPGIWMQMGLHCRERTPDCTLDVSGFTFSGLPGVVIGHNADIAWGFTNLGPDVSDLYLEKVRGDTWTRAGRQLPLEVREETIRVRDGKDFTLRVRRTKHGPLISDVSQEASSVGANAAAADRRSGRATPAEGYAVALAWTALEPSTTADAILELNRASGWEEFRGAAAKFAVPAQNLVYADTQGNIGYQAPGLVPVRRPGHDGRVPAQGWLPRNDWTGDHVPFDALPSVLNPAEGFVVTANQAVVGEEYPYRLTDDWDHGFRSERIRTLLEAEQDVTLEEMLDIQTDELNPMAEVLVPYLLDLDELETQYQRDGLDLLAGWDGQDEAGSAAAAYFNVVWSNLLRLAFHDDLPDRIHPTGGDRWFTVVDRLLDEPAHPLWDDRETEDVREVRDDVLRQAVVDARDEMTRLRSVRPFEWTWGDLHQLDLENQTLGTSGVGIVERLLNRTGYEVGGGSSVVNATGWDASEGYTVTSAPSMRMVVSLADLDRSRWINLTGVSGHPASGHYVDQTELFVEGGTLPWPSSREAVEEAAEDRLLLRPDRPDGGED